MQTIGGDIRVTRNAAKVVLTVTNVEKQVEVNDGKGGTQRWQSDTDHMYVMFYNGVTRSTVHSQINDGRHYLPRTDDNCYFDLTSRNQLWRSLSPSNAVEPNKNLSHRYPFYTYLADWREGQPGEGHPSYMILVVPWRQVDEDGYPTGDAGLQNTYYQIETSTTSTYYENYFYHISINVGILGSFELPEPVKLESTYMIVPWGEKEVAASLREPNYLIVEQHAYTINNLPSASIPYASSHDIDRAYVTQVKYINTGDFTPKTVTNNTDTDGELTVNTYVTGETFKVTIDNGLLTLSHDISADQYTRYDVTVKIRNKAGLEEEVVFTIYPAIYVDVHEGGNVFVDGYFGHVNNPSGNNWDNTESTYYASVNYQNITNNGRTYGLKGTENYSGNWYDGYIYFLQTPYGQLQNYSRGGFAHTDLTRITITNFNKDDEQFTITNGNGQTTSYTYQITDPRVASGWRGSDLINRLVSNQETINGNNNYRYSETKAWSNDEASKILIGTDDIESISPDFYISSGWGQCVGQTLTFDEAKKRAATYQESGYPAGRWRLPTEAELKYVFTLQDKGIIPRLFNESSYYWASSGRFYYKGRFYNSGARIEGYTTTTVWMRCVYDIWYWGDEPMTPNTYHVAP